MSSSHAYKRVAPVETPFSFAKAVTDLGDLWHCSSHLPVAIRGRCAIWEHSHDHRDSALMTLMEMGNYPRVES